MNFNRDKTSKTARQVLAAVLTAAGIYGSAQASDSLVSPELSNDTSEQIIRALSGNDFNELDEILSATSIDELTGDQRAVLLKLVQNAANKIKFRQAPFA